MQLFSRKNQIKTATRSASPYSRILLGFAAAVMATAAYAQSADTAPSGGTIIVKEGTDVKLRFAEDLSSKTAVLDDPVNLVLDEDLRIGDIVVARSGAKAVAYISSAKKAGMMGKGGELSIRLESLRAGDYKIKLRGTKNREGDSKVGTAVVLTVLFGPIGLIKHGKNIEIKSGTPLLAYVSDDAAVPPVR